MSAKDGTILTTLPLPGGSDGAQFNPATMEAFATLGNGRLAVVKETSPTSFALEQDLETMNGARTIALDTKNRPRLHDGAAIRAASPATGDAAGRRASRSWRRPRCRSARIVHDPDGREVVAARISSSPHAETAGGASFRIR